MTTHSKFFVYGLRICYNKRKNDKYFKESRDRVRRKDREVTNKEDILKIIDKCDSCSLGLCDGNRPYIIPMNYGYTYENHQLVLYFHSGMQGKKLELIKQNNNVCFSMDCSHELVHNEIACRYTMKYESVIGHGKIYVVTEEEEKAQGMQIVMKKYAPDRSFTFEKKHTNIITVLKLVVEEFTGKQSTKGGAVGESNT